MSIEFKSYEAKKAGKLLSITKIRHLWTLKINGQYYEIKLAESLISSKFVVAIQDEIVFDQKVNSDAKKKGVEVHDEHMSLLFKTGNKDLELFVNGVKFVVNSKSKNDFEDNGDYGLQQSNFQPKNKESGFGHASNNFDGGFNNQEIEQDDSDDDDPFANFGSKQAKPQGSSSNAFGGPSININTNKNDNKLGFKFKNDAKKPNQLAQPTSDPFSSMGSKQPQNNAFGSQNNQVKKGGKAKDGFAQFEDDNQEDDDDDIFFGVDKGKQVQKQDNINSKFVMKKPDNQRGGFGFDQPQQSNDPFGQSNFNKPAPKNDPFSAFGGTQVSHQQQGFGQSPNMNTKPPLQQNKSDPFSGFSTTPAQPNPSNQGNMWSNFSMNQKPQVAPNSNQPPNNGFGFQPNKPQPSNDPFDFQVTPSPNTNNAQGNAWNNFQVQPQQNRQAPLNNAFPPQPQQQQPQQQRPGQFQQPVNQPRPNQPVNQPQNFWGSFQPNQAPQQNKPQQPPQGFNQQPNAFNQFPPQNQQRPNNQQPVQQQQQRPPQPPQQIQNNNANPFGQFQPNQFGFNQPVQQKPVQQPQPTQQQQPQVPPQNTHQPPPQPVQTQSSFGQPEHTPVPVQQSIDNQFGNQNSQWNDSFGQKQANENQNHWGDGFGQPQPTHTDQSIQQHQTPNETNQHNTTPFDNQQHAVETHDQNQAKDVSNPQSHAFDNNLNFDNVHQPPVDQNAPTPFSDFTNQEHKLPTSVEEVKATNPFNEIPKQEQINAEFNNLNFGNNENHIQE